ncbi:AAA family ATPase [Clostridium taeniosporum]|nr:AAA family ATPase [Clostridium taeniosporum]
MKIKTIEYENFRNFKERGIIRCSTDGKITIVYGKNGDGKTTLHQLFQWIFYGQVHFNKTTSDYLYNLEFESNLEYGNSFEVMGRIDFEHNSNHYSLTRKYTYRKELDYSKKLGEEISLIRMDEDNNWKKIDRPSEIIEKLLPSGLSDYFFFDGENMIADLRVKGKDSANKLKKALYSMFDLDVIELAKDHVGNITSPTTVLGKLYMSKGTVKSGSQISAVKTNIENAQNKIEKYNEELKVYSQKKEKMKELIRTVSEQIGSTKSKVEYEKQRKILKRHRDLSLSTVTSTQGIFGDEMFSTFPQLLISKTVLDAKNKIKLKIADNNLPQGLGKRLIEYLLDSSTKECICGNSISNEEREHIKAYLNMLPPKSYTSMYNEFKRTASQWGKGYNKEKFERYIKLILENKESAEEDDKKIRELDEQEKKSPDIENLVIARKQAEDSILELDEHIINHEKELNKFKIYLKKNMKDFDDLTKKNNENLKIQSKINIMQLVADYFKKKLEDASLEYSKNLEENIQKLLNEMLTSKRKVSVTHEFSVRVTDSFNDESKSEGQFAVVSFAYIGGILKMLQNDQRLNKREYPLVLDGPFSKLDPDQRQNVVDSIPQFAPQVILFSKDNLQDIIAEDKIGRVWTIISNNEKNVARVEEGILWK